MVEISKCKEPCFADRQGVCAVLTTDCDGTHCGFYKPAGCKDWIKLEHNGQVWLLAPEEYYGEV